MLKTNKILVESLLEIDESTNALEIFHHLMKGKRKNICDMIETSVLKLHKINMKILK